MYHTLLIWRSLADGVQYLHVIGDDGLESGQYLMGRQERQHLAQGIHQSHTLSRSHGVAGERLLNTRDHLQHQRYEIGESFGEFDEYYLFSVWFHGVCAVSGDVLESHGRC